MLEGSDKEWSTLSNKSSVSFGNLFEGKYTYRLKAQNIDGIWSKQLSYSFTVSPPLWRTWWAYFIYSLLFIVIVFIVHRYQKQRLIRIERRKAQIRELAQAKEIEKAYTELKATQAQLIQSEKMASLGELTAGIAHEIQNPLNFVNNFSEVSKELLDEMKTELDNGNTEDAKEIANDVIQNLEKINQHGKRADAIVKGMLQHSSSSSGIKEPTNINALSNEYLRIAYYGYQAKNKSFKATLKTDFDESIGKIDIIPQDIGRVILNLIMNAFYAVDEKKKSQTLEGFENYEPAVSVSTHHSLSSGEGRGEVLISIKDNGPGIPQKAIDKIFQPFFTTKPTGQGTGLGLSLAYDIIKAHGGELKVETQEEIGSEFIIRIPV
jgi:signal transduction histidine kinase